MTQPSHSAFPYTLDKILADAARYLYLRDLLWNQDLSAFSGKARVWLWSARFASHIECGSGFSLEEQGPALDAAIDAAITQEQK